MNQDWDLFQFDVKNTFLHGDPQEVFMEQPPGFVAVEESDQVCILKKSIYGLKHSPRVWFDKFSNLLLRVGFTRTVSDHSVFVKHNSLGCIILMVYVDDIIISGSDGAGIQATKQWLQSQLHVKDLGKMQYFLGIVVSRNQHDILMN